MLNDNDLCLVMNTASGLGPSACCDVWPSENVLHAVPYGRRGYGHLNKPVNCASLIIGDGWSIEMKIVGFLPFSQAWAIEVKLVG